MYVRICSVQSDLVFDFSSPEDKGAGFDSNPLVGGNVRRSAESTFSAGVPSGEHSGRVEGRGQASNRADMNRESKNGTYEDFSSVGANSRKDLRRVSTMQDSPMQERRLKESENAGVARSTLSRQRSEEHRRTSLGHNVGALAIAPLSGREDTVMTLENTVRICLRLRTKFAAFGMLVLIISQYLICKNFLKNLAVTG